jgi:hypothetical protein
MSPTKTMISGCKFELDTIDFLPNFMASLQKLPNTPVMSWEKMVSTDNQGHPFEVEGEYPSSERPNFR